MYFNGSTNCYIGEVMMVPKIATQNSGGTCNPLHLPAGAHGPTPFESATACHYTTATCRPIV